MTQTALAVVLIALPDSVNPSLILAALYQTAKPRRTRRTAAFTLAAFVTTLAGGILIAFGLRDLVLKYVPKPSPTVKYSFVIAAGAVLLVGSLVIWLRRESLAIREKKTADRTRGGSGSAAVLGVGIAGVELLSAFPYFAAIAIVVSSSPSVGGKIGLLVLYNVVYCLPLFAIVGVCLVMGRRADAILSRMRVAVMTRWPVVVAPLAALIGGGLIAYGITRLP